MLTLSSIPERARKLIYNALAILSYASLAVCAAYYITTSSVPTWAASVAAFLLLMSGNGNALASIHTLLPASTAINAAIDLEQTTFGPSLDLTAMPTADQRTASIAEATASTGTEPLDTSQDDALAGVATFNASDGTTAQ